MSFWSAATCKTGRDLSLLFGPPRNCLLRISDAHTPAPRESSTSKLVTALPSLRKFEGFLVALATVAAIVLTVRAAAGPFQIWGISTLVNSPFASENVLWAAVFGLLCLRYRPAMNPTPNGATEFPRPFLALALFVIAVAFVRNLADPFLSDDYIILNSSPFNWQAFLATLNRAGGDGSFRPLGTVYYQTMRAFAGTSPIAWHAAGLFLHLLNAALVFAVAWKLWRDKTAAAVACLVFGLHGTRPEAALWMAGTCDLLACACVLGCIILALSQNSLAISLPLVAAAVLFKESAYAAPLVACAMIFTHPPGPVRRSLTRFTFGSLAVCAVLFAWRWHLFNGPGGYTDPTTGRPAILSLHPWTATKALAFRIWDILLVPVNWDATLSWWLPAAVIASLVCLILLVSASHPTRTQFCLIAGTCCAVLPAMHLALIGQSEMGSRILYLAGAPFALLIGSLIPGTGKRSAATAAIMLVGMAGILEHNLSAWHRAAIHAQTLCRDPAAQPDKPPSGAFEGVFLFQNGFPECVATARKRE